MKNVLTKIDELKAYRLLFICASILALVVGIFAIQNSASLTNLNNSLAVGQYQDKAELIKTANDTQCLYGSENPEQYDFSAHKDSSLDCLQVSRSFNDYYLRAGNSVEVPDFTLSYDFSDIKEALEFCSSSLGREGEVGELALGSLGTTHISCKDDPKTGKSLELSNKDS